MSKKESKNENIVTLYAPGYAYVNFSFYLNTLVFKFVPWLEKNDKGKDTYCKNRFASLAVNGDEAASLLMLVHDIIKGEITDDNVEYTVVSKKEASIKFKHKRDKNNATLTVLVIKKDNEKIQFNFQVSRHYKKRSESEVEWTIETGLHRLTAALIYYLRIAEVYNSLSGEFREFVDSFKPPIATTGMPVLVAISFSVDTSVITVTTFVVVG